MSVDMAHKLSLLYESKDIKISKRLKSTLLGDLEKRKQDICAEYLKLDRENVLIEQTIERLKIK